MLSHLRIWICIFLAGALFSGCAGALVAGGAALGATTVLFVQGEMETEFSSPIQEVYQATLVAMERLQFDVIEQRYKPHQGIVRAEMADGKIVRVKIVPQKRKSTRVSVRVGVFGDESISSEVLLAIWNELKKKE